MCLDSSLSPFILKTITTTTTTTKKGSCTDSVPGDAGSSLRIECVTENKKVILERKKKREQQGYLS